MSFNRTLKWKTLRNGKKMRLPLMKSAADDQPPVPHMTSKLCRGTTQRENQVQREWISFTNHRWKMKVYNSSSEDILTAGSKSRIYIFMVNLTQMLILRKSDIIAEQFFLLVLSNGMYFEMSTLFFLLFKWWRN